MLKFFSLDNSLEYVLEVPLVSSQLPTGAPDPHGLAHPSLPPPPRPPPPAQSKASGSLQG